LGVFLCFTGRHPNPHSHAAILKQDVFQMLYFGNHIAPDQKGNHIKLHSLELLMFFHKGLGGLL